MTDVALRLFVDTGGIPQADPVAISCNYDAEARFLKL